MPTFSDIVAITNNGSADAESAASTISVTPGATITKITVQDLTVGHTYAVKVSFPGVTNPQRYVVPSNGMAGTNGGKLVAGLQTIDCRIPVPQGLSSVQITTYGDTASATVEVGVQWQAGKVTGNPTQSDFTATTAAGTAETKVGTINVPGGAAIKKITVASRLGVGLLKNVRLDYSGVQAPQKYSTGPIIYDATGTEVQNSTIQGNSAIDVDIQLPSNVATVDVYGTSQTASNTVAIGLIWV